MPDPTADTFDVVILGGGSGGYACAIRAAELGLRVALVEQDKVGGTCLHRGCIPTKALLHVAEVADQVRHAGALGVQASLDKIDMPAALRFKDGVVARLHKGLQGLLSAHQIEIVHGRGRLSSPTTIDVGDRRLTGRNVVLATGSHVRSLPGIEIEGRVLSSDQALELDWLPGSAIVLGGGVIGVEFASLWAGLGVQVTILEALPSLLPTEDPAAGKALQRAFRKRGIDVRLGVRVAGERRDDSGVTVRLADETEVRADLMLVAVGRGGNGDGNGFEQAGVRVQNGLVPTDERLRTDVPGVYAVGDLVPGPQLAHRGFAHGIFVAEEIAGLQPAPVVDALIPRVTYSDPEVASVGLTGEAATAQADPAGIEEFEYNLGGNGKSQILGTTGFVKLVRAVDGPLLGVVAVGARMGEQIGEASLLVNWEAFPDDVASILHAHPSQSEAMGEAAMALAGKPLHVHT